MSALQWECDICERSRYSSQMLRCDACTAQAKAPRFIGYCCLDKHTKEKHAGAVPPDKSAVGILYTKVNHIEDR
jgi:hypothetical protein